MTRIRKLLARSSVVLVTAALFVVVSTAVQVGSLNVVNTRFTLTMWGAMRDHRRAHGEVALYAQQWRDLDALGKHVPRAVVSAEDQKFFAHRGFDVDAIVDAIEHNAEHPERRRGASTISQQVARNVFLWQGGGWLRKGLEAWYTVWLELLVPKRRILEIYLNVAETGPLTFGFEAGGRQWYGRKAADLTPLQAASVAALLPAPRRWKPGDANVNKRAAWILRNPAPMDRDRARELLGRDGK